MPQPSNKSDEAISTRRRLLIALASNVFKPSPQSQCADGLFCSRSRYALFSRRVRQKMQPGCCSYLSVHYKGVARMYVAQGRKHQGYSRGIIRIVSTWCPCPKLCCQVTTGMASPSPAAKALEAQTVAAMSVPEKP
eukprot:TRINITY_DN20374_c0_g1_i2.p1 TRINITY_DN20374_c0_g1~~TRINITY_DN20374_c0_g1_i2.p1  ORF type:complete len:136 (-),score=21.80 TRINITY_DN20374_c0_g1_i2:234-641(-)